MIRIKAKDNKGNYRILSKENSMKLGKILINTKIAKEAFLGGIDFEYNGLRFCRVDI